MTSEEKKAFLLAAIDFGSGAVSDYPFGADGLYIKYKNELCLHIWWWEGGYYHNCYLKKEDATIDCYSSKAINESFVHRIWHFVNEIEHGKYKNKKSLREMIIEIVQRRGLTSCMNNTKWREFREAMEYEMPFKPPYIYKTLFEEETGEYFEFSKDVPYTGDYDRESFEDYNYKVIEWVKVRPSYYESKGGRLVEQKVFHEAKQEFIQILEKYSIPYDEENGTYIIYGYR